MPRIESDENDTGHNDVAQIPDWIDGTGSRYKSRSISWALFELILEKNEGATFTERPNEPVRITFRNEVLRHVKEAAEEEGSTSRDDWDVVVNRSQPDGDVWQTASAGYYAHPIYNGGNSSGVAVASDGGDLQAAEITYV